MAPVYGVAMTTTAGLTYTMNAGTGCPVYEGHTAHCSMQVFLDFGDNARDAGHPEEELDTIALEWAAGWLLDSQPCHCHDFDA